MATEIFKAESRGGADYGWLKTHYSFSFANYYEPRRMGFGKLRVLNDDTIAGGGGFPFHSHENMEIVTIPLSGSLEHKDTHGGTGVVTPSDVQIMSAGTGITHSEFNHSKTEPLSLFQIWIEPEIFDVAPRYEQKSFDPEKRKDAFQFLVSPHGGDALQIFQDAYIAIHESTKNQPLTYDLHSPAHGVFIIVIKGELAIDGATLTERDAAEITGIQRVELTASEGTIFLSIEVPMA